MRLGECIACRMAVESGVNMRVVRRERCDRECVFGMEDGEIRAFILGGFGVLDMKGGCRLGYKGGI